MEKFTDSGFIKECFWQIIYAVTILSFVNMIGLFIIISFISWEPNEWDIIIWCTALSGMFVGIANAVDLRNKKIEIDQLKKALEHYKSIQIND